MLVAAKEVKPLTLNDLPGVLCGILNEDKPSLEWLSGVLIEGLLKAEYTKDCVYRLLNRIAYDLEQRK